MEQWCYQNLTDGDQEARLQHQIAIVLVKCLTGCETKGMQKWDSGPVGSDEIHGTYGEKPSFSLVKGKKYPAYLRNKVIHTGCLGRVEVIWSLDIYIVLWKI